MPQAHEIELPAKMQGGFALLAEALNRYPIPEAMLGGGTVLAEMDEEFRLMAANALLGPPPDQHKRDRKPIIVPRFDIEMHGLPQVFGAAVRDMDFSMIPEVERIELASSHAPQPEAP